MQPFSLGHADLPRRPELPAEARRGVTRLFITKFRRMSMRNLHYWLVQWDMQAYYLLQYICIYIAYTPHLHKYIMCVYTLYVRFNHIALPQNDALKWQHRLGPFLRVLVCFFLGNSFIRFHIVISCEDKVVKIPYFPVKHMGISTKWRSPESPGSLAWQC